jgi:4-hydroxybenzoate polyprenyltransferase
MWGRILTLLFLGSPVWNTRSKGYFLAAVEGFSHHGVSRPWEPSNNNKKRVERKEGHLLIRYYVNEHGEDSSADGTASDGTNTTASVSDAEDVATAKEGFPGSSAHVMASGVVAASTYSNTGSATVGSPLQPLAHAASKPTSSDATVKSCLPDLFAMTRPYNLPVVVLFHMLGIYLSQQNVGFVKVMLAPPMMVTLMALLLTSSTSMLVNDYYDFKLGHDSMKPFKPLGTPKRLPLHVAKRFLSYLYAGALICLTMVPGVPARLTVVMGLMLTFWYTEHLKPRTWLKNAVCASLVALSPLTSGVAAMSMTGTSGGWVSLLRVVAILFIGILGREITMDINDSSDDGLHGVRTVPVVYGTKFASTIGLVCSAAVAGLSVAGPLGEFLTGTWNRAVLRRSVLAVVGGLVQLRNGWNVFQTEGQDSEVVNKAVTEGLFTVVLLLASFV